VPVPHTNVMAGLQQPHHHRRPHLPQPEKRDLRHQRSSISCAADPRWAGGGSACRSRRRLRYTARDRPDAYATLDDLGLGDVTGRGCAVGALRDVAGRNPLLLLTALLLAATLEVALPNLEVPGAEGGVPPG